MSIESDERTRAKDPSNAGSGGVPWEDQGTQGGESEQSDEKAQQARHKPDPNRHQSSEHQIMHSGRSSMVSDIRHAITGKYNQIFLLTSHNGDIERTQTGFGIYFQDTEYLDELELRINGQAGLSLLANEHAGSDLRYELTNDDIEMANGQKLPKERLAIRRTYHIGADVKHEIGIRNMSQEDAQLDLDLHFGSHFINMFVVRGTKNGQRGTLHGPTWKDGELVFAYDGADQHKRTTTISFSQAPGRTDGGTATWPVTLKSRDEFQLTVTLKLRDQGPPGPWEQQTGEPAQSHPDALTQHDRFCEKLSHHARLESDNNLFNRVLDQAFNDISMLIIADHGDTYISAGVPWYAALFGRDSCIAAYQMLAYSPDLARSTLEVLARYQGYEHNEFQDEEPGKILHELRTGEKARLKEVPQYPYYGSVDSTPWWLLLLGEYVRWTGDLKLYERLEDNIHRALGWMNANPARQGKEKYGFLTYGAHMSKSSLSNQGWKDSGNSIVNTDGSLAKPPISLIEVQGLAYKAKRNIAYCERLRGNQQLATELDQQADEIRRRVNDVYWMESKNYYAMALQADDKQVQAVASNPGQALGFGVIDEDKAQAVVDHLLAPDMFSGWGIRTLSANERAYNPVDYQVGAVWPHDNSLISVGLWQYGFGDAFERVFTALYEAATRFRKLRLPEVFDGFGRDDYERPVHYPVACNPQAWAAGAMPLMTRVAMGLEPDASAHTLRIKRPRLPGIVSHLSVRGVTVGDAKVDLEYLRQGDTTLVAVGKKEGDLTVSVEY